MDDKPLRVIDVSKWNGNFGVPPIPNYGMLFSEKIDLVIAKATQGQFPDVAFHYTVGECSRVGIPWSGYHFWGVTDTWRDIEAFVRLCRGCTTTIPLTLDFEPPMTQSVEVTAKRFRQALIDFENAAGYKPYIYSGYPFWNRFFPVKPDWLGDYKLWLAAYPLKKKTWAPENQWDMSQYYYQTPKLPNGWLPDQLVGWQFCEKGSIPSFGKSVDLDWVYV
jgi:GH25 family lysozyme M1 (1,4-beta-N-acetylmuramidase)